MVQRTTAPTRITYNQSEDVKYKDWDRGKIKIILISGRIASGKSTLGDSLVRVLSKTYPKYIIKRHSFGHYVKEVAKRAFGWDGKKDCKGRRLLQVVGTEAGREYDSDIWVRRAYNNISNAFPPDIVIFDDWRFENEYTYFLNRKEIGDIYKIRTFRDEEVKSEHISEKSLPTLRKDFYDYWFDNNCSIDEIDKFTKEMIEELKI